MSAHFNCELLRSIRLEAKYTQTEIAKRLDVTRESIGAIENEYPGTHSIPGDGVGETVVVCMQP